MAELVAGTQQLLTSMELAAISPQLGFMAK